VKTLAPLEGDNTAQIQTAIDEVSLRTPGASGLRGVVALKAGDYRVNGTVTIAASGVVLRGGGAADGGTVIHLTGGPHRFLEIRGAGALRAVGNSAAINDAYIPAGASTFHVWATPMWFGGRLRKRGSTSWAWTRWSATAKRRPGSRPAALSTPTASYGPFPAS